VSLGLISFALALMTVAQSWALYCSFGRWILRAKQTARGEGERERLYVKRETASVKVRLEAPGDVRDF